MVSLRTERVDLRPLVQQRRQMGSHLSEDCGRGPGPRGPRDQRVSAAERTLRADSSQEARDDGLKPWKLASRAGGKVVTEGRQSYRGWRILEVTARRVRNGKRKLQLGRRAVGREDGWAAPRRCGRAPPGRGVPCLESGPPAPTSRAT